MAETAAGIGAVGGGASMQAAAHGDLASAASSPAGMATMVAASSFSPSHFIITTNPTPSPSAAATPPRLTSPRLSLLQGASPSPSGSSGSASTAASPMKFSPLSAIPEASASAGAGGLTAADRADLNGNDHHATEMLEITMGSPSRILPSPATPSTHFHSQSRGAATPSRSTFGTPTLGGSTALGGRAVTGGDNNSLRTPVGSSTGSRLLGLLGRGARQPSAPSTPQQMPVSRLPGSAAPQQSKSAQSSPVNLGPSHLAPPSTNRDHVRRPSLSLLSSEAEVGVDGSDTGAYAGTVEPPGSMRPDVMISYSRKDIHYVKRLFQHFENAGRAVWVDFKCIPKAVDFMESIRSGIRESNSFIYILSPDSVASKYCDAELEYALQYGKRIIPVVIRDVNIEKVRQEIRSINWIFCMASPAPTTAPANGVPAPTPVLSASAALHDVFPIILDSVLVDPAYALMHTKLLVRAMEWEENGEETSFLASGRELEEANRWMARSRVYAAQQAAASSRRSSASGGLKTVQSRGAIAVPAPQPTRIQKLFVFASNERMADSRRKERLLEEFLAPDDEPGEGGEDEDDEEHIDVSPRRVSVSMATAAAPGSPEHGSLGPSRHTSPQAAPPNGPARSGSIVRRKDSAVKRRSMTGHHSRTASSSTLPGSSHPRVAGHFLPHLSATSAYAAFHRRDLRRVIANQNDFMAEFMSCVQMNEREREAVIKQQDEAQQQQQHPTNPHSPEFASTLPRPPTPPVTIDQPSRFDALRFTLFTAHESTLFLWLLRVLLAVEAFLVLLSLILVTGGFAAPQGSSAYDSGAADAIRPLRIILLFSLALFALELFAVISIIHFGLRRLWKQQSFLLCYALITCVIILEAVSWDCKGLQDFSPSRSSSGAFGSSSCHGNLYLWALLLRSWHVFVRAQHSLRLQPLLHSLHTLHLSLVHGRATITKLKQMVSILTGEIGAVEAANKNKWEKLKNFHPARRFSKAVISDTGFNNPGGNLCTPPSAAEMAHAGKHRATAARLGAKSTRTLPSGNVAVAPPRRASMMPPSPNSQRLNALNDRRFSTINVSTPGLLLHPESVLMTPKRTSQLTTPLPDFDEVERPSPSASDSDHNKSSASSSAHASAATSVNASPLLSPLPSPTHCEPPSAAIASDGSLKSFAHRAELTNELSGVTMQPMSGAPRDRPSTQSTQLHDAGDLPADPSSNVSPRSDVTSSSSDPDSVTIHIRSESGALEVLKQPPAVAEEESDSDQTSDVDNGDEDTEGSEDEEEDQAEDDEDEEDAGDDDDDDASDGDDSLATSDDLFNSTALQAAIPDSMAAHASSNLLLSPPDKPSFESPLSSVAGSSSLAPRALHLELTSPPNAFSPRTHPALTPPENK